MNGNSNFDKFFPYSIIILLTAFLLLQFHYYQKQKLEIEKLSIELGKYKYQKENQFKQSHSYTVNYHRKNYYKKPPLEFHNHTPNTVLNRNVPDSIKTEEKKQIIKININTATYEELLKIPHIGPKKARSIIIYRRIHGPFRKIEDLMKIKGIGKKTLQKIKNYIEL